MSIQTFYSGPLSTAIEAKYKCRATHLQSVPVKERDAGGRMTWRGTVEVFAMVGSKLSGMCYAWIDNPNTRAQEIVTVLQIGLIDSPGAAVKAWLAFKTVPMGAVILAAKGKGAAAAVAAR